MRLLPLFLCILGACGSKMESEGWTLSGNLGGYSLQQEVRSAGAQVVADGSSVLTAITLSSIPNYCASLKQGGCLAPDASKRLLVFRLNGTRPATYPITPTPFTVATGQAGLVWIRLEKDCMAAAPDIPATSGTVTVTELDTSPEGMVALTFSGQTAQGPISGSVRARTCP
jgi:hypothetical protein